MFDKLRMIVGKYFFRKEQLKMSHDHKLVNLEKAKYIGILYTLDDLPVYDVVTDFVTQLQRQHIEVKALGFVRNRNLISRFLPKLSYDFFSTRDINWFYRPIHNKVKDFINKEFDILIDLSLKDSFTLQYISGLSRSFCRVGKFSEENTNYYDLLFDVNSSLALPDYIQQITHYLTIINHHATSKR
jgi:hypothetical protein